MCINNDGESSGIVYHAERSVPRAKLLSANNVLFPRGIQPGERRISRSPVPVNNQIRASENPTCKRRTDVWRSGDKMPRIRNTRRSFRNVVVLSRVAGRARRCSSAKRSTSNFWRSRASTENRSLKVTPRERYTDLKTRYALFLYKIVLRSHTQVSNIASRSSIVTCRIMLLLLLLWFNQFG